MAAVHSLIRRSDTGPLAGPVTVHFRSGFPCGGGNRSIWQVMPRIWYSLTPGEPKAHRSRALLHLHSAVPLVGRGLNPLCGHSGSTTGMLRHSNPSVSRARLGCWPTPPSVFSVVADFARDGRRLGKSLIPNSSESGEPRSKEAGFRRTLLARAVMSGATSFRSAARKGACG